MNDELALFVVIVVDPPKLQFVADGDDALGIVSKTAVTVTV